MQQIDEVIYSISKEIIQKQFPEEIEYFDIIWEVIKERIINWKENIPQELHIKDYQDGLKEELQFLDENEINGINTPKVIALISLVWLRLAELKGQVQDADIEETIAKYGKSLPEWLRLKTIGLAVPMIKEDLKKIGRFPIIEEEEEKKYVMYFHDKKEGKHLTEKQYSTQKDEDNHDYLIWINAITDDLFILGEEPEEIYPKEIRALRCLIKRIGDVISHKELYEAMHNIEISLANWENYYIRYRDDVYRCKCDIKKHCPEISEFVTTKSGGGYKLAFPRKKKIKYCLLERLSKENT